MNVVRDLVDFNDEVHVWLKLLERQKSFLQRLQEDCKILDDYHEIHPVPEHLHGSGEDALTLIHKAIISVDIRKLHMDQTFAESNRILEAVSHSSLHCKTGTGRLRHLSYLHK